MEPRFKTSFIPKQTLSTSSNDVPRPSIVSRGTVGPSGLGMFISLIIFLGTIGFAGGLFLYDSYLNSSIKAKKEQLEISRKAFQPELIRQLARLDNRITAATGLLEQHVAPSLFFELLQANTLQTVRFSSLSLVMGQNGGQFSLTGEAKNFASVALQSDVFGSSQYIQEPVITDFNVIGGGVGFEATGRVDKNLLLYSQTVSIDTSRATQ
jgi:hypothetical protein